MSRLSTKKVSKRATAPQVREAKVKKNEGMNGGVHSHWLSDQAPGFTGNDGYHCHVFVVGGKLIKSEYGGEHRHKVEGAKIGPQLQPHHHDLFVDEKFYMTESGGTHEHSEGFDPEYPERIMPGGVHRHVIEIDSVTYESITPADVLSVQIRKSLHVGIQSVLFNKDRFLTFEKAAAKAESLGLDLKKFEERQTQFVFIQADASKFKELSLQTIDMEDGVEAVIGILVEEEEESETELDPSAMSANPAEGKEEEAAFEEVQAQQTLGYVMMSDDDASQLGNLKDEFAAQVQALKSVVQAIAEPVTAFLDDWIEKATGEENNRLISLLDRVNTTVVLLDEAVSKIELDVEVSIDKGLEAELTQKTNESVSLALKTLGDVLDPVIELFHDTSFENFHRLCKSAKLSSDRLVREVLSVDKALMPSGDMTREELRSSQEERAKKFGVEVVSGSALTFPAGFPTDLSDYGDPVNLKFPFETEARARNARVRFKQFADQIYSEEASKKIVHERIVRRELELGIEVEIDPNNALDKLLPADIKDAEGVTVVDSEGLVQKNWFVPLFKMAGEQRTVFGIVLEPDVVDLHGDTYDGETVEMAAHKFMEDFQNMGLNHTEFVNGQVKILESFIAPVDMKIDTPGGKVSIKKNTWLMKVRIIDNDIWSDVKSGGLTGFSIGAIATVQELGNQ